MGVAAAGMVVGVEAAFTVEAVGFMDLAPMVAGRTLVMDGVAMALTFRLTAFMDMDLVATP